MLLLQSLEGGLEEGVALLTGSIPWVFQFASEALERCQQLTGGWGLNGLVKSLQVSCPLLCSIRSISFLSRCQSFLLQYVSSLSSCMHQLKRMCVVKVGEEWSHVQHAFSLIQLCGHLLLQTHTLSEQLNLALINSAPKLHNPACSSAPFNYYDYLAVYHPEEHTAALELLAAGEKGNGETYALVLEIMTSVQVSVLIGNLLLLFQEKGCGHCLAHSRVRCKV